MRGACQILLAACWVQAAVTFSPLKSQRPSIALREQQEVSSEQEVVPTIRDLRKLTTKTALLAVCGLPSSLPLRDDKSFYYEDVDILKSAPTMCRFVLANPKAMYDEPLIAKSVGLDFSTLDPATPLTALAALLPVIYIAEVHPEYGTLGYILNKAAGITLNEIMPEFRSFRNRPVYLGGVQSRGSSFTMVHSKTGFTENRPFRGLPGDKTSFRLFFSPDVAMANELCSTKDATPSEFKFFQWATVWLPKQLDLEYDRKAWLTVKAPMQVIFDDDDATRKPLWRRLIASLPPGRLA